nr:MAG TPA: hypothetical protein [Caudoviricetes sp.]
MEGLFFLPSTVPLSLCRGLPMRNSFFLQK